MELCGPLKKTNFAAGLSMLIILMAGILSASARKFDKCSLAEELKGQVPADQLAMWVCLATHESGLDTAALNTQNLDGSWDHGLFKLNDRYWVGRNGRGGACELSANDVRDDDIRNDVQCVLKIYDEHQRLFGDGFNAWTTYSNHGQCHSDVESYTEGC